MSEITSRSFAATMTYNSNTMIFHVVPPNKEYKQTPFFFYMLITPNFELRHCCSK